MSMHLSSKECRTVIESLETLIDKGVSRETRYEAQQLIERFKQEERQNYYGPGYSW